MFFVVLNFIKMAIRQNRSRRKPSGGRYKDYRKSRAFDLGREPTYTKVGKKKTKVLKGRSRINKRILLSCDEANVFDGKKYHKVKIQTILENPANRHFIRRNIITKGAVIQTELGKAKLTNRPGQEGSINAVLVK